MDLINGRTHPKSRALVPPASNIRDHADSIYFEPLSQGCHDLNDKQKCDYHHRFLYCYGFYAYYSSLLPGDAVVCFLVEKLGRGNHTNKTCAVNRFKKIFSDFILPLL